MPFLKGVFAFAALSRGKCGLLSINVFRIPATSLLFSALMMLLKLSFSAAMYRSPFLCPRATFTPPITVALS